MPHLAVDAVGHPILPEPLRVPPPLPRKVLDDEPVPARRRGIPPILPVQARLQLELVLEARRGRAQAVELLLQAPPRGARRAPPQVYQKRRVAVAAAVVLDQLEDGELVRGGGRVDPGEHNVARRPVEVLDHAVDAGLRVDDTRRRGGGGVARSHGRA